MTTYLAAAPRGLARVLLAGAVALVSACASPSAMPGKTVDVEGRSYVISALTAGTWTVLGSGSKQTLPRTPASRAALIKAVETLSGCKVTDSDYTQDGLQLDAQVDCAGVKS